MVVLAQLVRASDCGSEGRGFEPHTPPFISGNSTEFSLFCVYTSGVYTVENALLDRIGFGCLKIAVSCCFSDSLCVILSDL